MENFGFFRIASSSPKVSVADCKANTDAIIDEAVSLYKAGVSLVVFPELCITSYTCADLFHNQALIDDALLQLERLLEASLCKFHSCIVVGIPLVVDGALYNCGVALCRGQVLAVVPKSYLPNYNEFYEKRWWRPAPAIDSEISISSPSGLLITEKVTFGVHQLVEIDGVKVGIEICEDLWTPIPPSCYAAMAGADIIVNLSASDDLIGKYSYIQQLISQQSARCICAYAYASAGYGESSTDLVFDGKTFIAENGKILAHNRRWHAGSQHVIADVDIEALRRDRLHLGSFSDCAAVSKGQAYAISSAYTGAAESNDLSYRTIDPAPFVPPTDEAMAQRCDEITNIQIAGLAKRLDFIHSRCLVIGISGGLDSTLALLVAVGAFDRLGLDRKGIVGVTMPGFGTTSRTKNNAIALMQELDVTIRTIPIDKSVMQHFSDIDHDPELRDVTYENCQARERTQILMDLANKLGGIVLGTGDLSELALGWATYNGDHMSMYGVNAGVPKTLVKYLVRHFAMSMDSEKCRQTLLDIIDTPISPELIPATDKGEIAQITEDLVGPYDLHDFFLYYTLRYGFAPQKIYFMAKKAFEGRYDHSTIAKWLKTFVRRFFQQQFKRSCMPDGPKVGSVCLSPRGDWRMPSDAVAFNFDI